VLDITGLRGNSRERRAVPEAEVKEETEKGVVRAAELRSALLGLNELSNNTTRRLDNSYYSVLEKLSALQSTIASFKELATVTKQLNEDFVRESEEVVRDAEIQLNGLGGFEEQQRTIERLEKRVSKGREKIKVLRGRVDLIRDRVEGWERAEGEWQEKTRKRLRAMWIIMSVCAGIFVAIAIFQYTPSRMPDPGEMEGLNASSIVATIPRVDHIRNETWSLKKSTVEALEIMQRKRREQELEKEQELQELVDDPRLRLFDEL